MNIIYKGEDVELVFSAQVDMSSYSKEVTCFTTLSAPKIATIEPIDNFQFKAIISKIATADLAPGRMNVVLKITDSQGKVAISKAADFVISDPNLDGSIRRNANSYNIAMSFNEDINIAIETGSEYLISQIALKITECSEATDMANIAASSALENAALANEKAGLANSAAILAGQRASEAEEAAQAANETAQHPTYIGADHYVYIWNPSTKAYGKTDTYCKGDAFSISKVYASVAAMNADFAGLDTKVGDFVLIETGNVEDPDNSKLYVKTSTEWAYLTDLSGAIGFTGKTPQLSIGAVTTGAAGSSAQVSISENGMDASGNPKFNLNFAIPQGAKGDKGDKGDTGDTGKSAFQDYYDNTSDNPKLTQEEWNLLQAETPSKELERQLNEQGRISNENSRLSTYENLEQATAAAFNEMARRIEALEKILREYKLTSADIDTLNYKTMTKEGCPLYYESDSAPTIVPDFVGQKFYKTTSPYAVYEAVGVTSVSHWVLL